MVETKNQDTPILERYIHIIFRKQSIDYNSVIDAAEEAWYFHVENECACFHTGLYTEWYKAVYAFFDRNKRRDSMLDWYFRGFCDEVLPRPKYIEPLPERPHYRAVGKGSGFYVNVTVIPTRYRALGQKKDEDKPKLCVAAYCRVSTDSKEQETSYEAQIEHYTEYINKNPEWELAGIFADEGLFGTDTRKRGEFNRMIEECMEGKINMVITKSISRFARNTLDCLKYIRQLKDRNIPVLFEKENINTIGFQR